MTSKIDIVMGYGIACFGLFICLFQTFSSTFFYIYYFEVGSRTYVAGYITSGEYYSGKWTNKANTDIGETYASKMTFLFTMIFLGMLLYILSIIVTRFKYTSGSAENINKVNTIIEGSYAILRFGYLITYLVALLGARSYISKEILSGMSCQVGFGYALHAFQMVLQAIGMLYSGFKIYQIRKNRNTDSLYQEQI